MCVTFTLNLGSQIYICWLYLRFKLHPTVKISCCCWGFHEVEPAANINIKTPPITYTITYHYILNNNHTLPLDLALFPLKYAGICDLAVLTVCKVLSYFPQCSASCCLCCTVTSTAAKLSSQSSRSSVASRPLQPPPLRTCPAPTTQQRTFPPGEAREKNQSIFLMNFNKN